MQSFMRMLSDFYKDINPSNLSGAIDIVVVEDVKTKELRCSPFHVRFGKGQVFSKPSERRVELIVNGKTVDGLEMRIGEAGEAYFLLNENGTTTEASSEFPSTSPSKPESPLHNRALSDLEASPTTSSSQHRAEPLSDSEVNYQKPAAQGDGVVHDPTSPVIAAKSPDWDWQWGDLPVHRGANGAADGSVSSFTSYMDIISFLQSARNIENAHRRMVESPFEWQTTLLILRTPLRVFSPRQLVRHFSDCLQDSIERVIDYEEDPLKLLEPGLLARVVVRFRLRGLDDSVFYLAGKVGLQAAVSLGVLSVLPPLNALLKLAEEPLEEPLPKEDSSQPVRSWRSWWSRSPVVAVTPSNSITALTQTSPIITPIPLLAKPPPIKSLRLNSDQLKLLNLHDGVNSIVFSVGGSNGRLACSSRIVKWPSNAKIVISDIDGTITKSDALGHFFAMVGKDWTHSGVVSLYNAISRNGYKFLYLTSRSIGQSHATQKYLRGIEQGKNQLPDGPIILSPERLFAAFKREIIIGNPEEFKIAALRDIQNLFIEDETSANPFYAGFGNRITDAQSYHAVGVPPSRIFTINAAGAVWVEQLLLVGGVSSTYLAMTDIVDLYFPPVHTAPREGDESFSDINWWRTTRWSEEDLGIPQLEKLAIVGIGEDLFLIGGEHGPDGRPVTRRGLSSTNQGEQNHAEDEIEGDNSDDFSDEDESASATPFPYI